MSVAPTGNFEMTTTLHNPAPWELSLKVVLKVLMVPCQHSHAEKLQPFNDVIPNRLLDRYQSTQWLSRVSDRHSHLAQL